MAVGSSSMVTSPAAPVAYTQADFNRENEAFKTLVISSPIPVTPVFSETVYEKADGVKFKTAVSCKNPSEMMRMASITYTHFAMLALDSFLLRAENPVERDASFVYERCMKMLPKEPTELHAGKRADLRKRIINIACSFFGKQMLCISKYLVASGKAENLQEAARSLVKDENGSFADALACDSVRALTRKW